MRPGEVSNHVDEAVDEVRMVALGPDPLAPTLVPESRAQLLEQSLALAGSMGWVGLP